MLKVALTGGIATGKSYVLARLKERGVPTIDADDIVHEALGPGTPATRIIAERFGAGFLNPDGGVNRARLGATVFLDQAVRREVEAILHPMVYRAIGAWFDALDAPFGVASIPLLYETGREGDFDVVAATTCTPDEQRRRIVERDGMSEDEAGRRIAAQWPAAGKAARADFVIATSGTTRETDAQVDGLLEFLGRRSGGGPQSN